MPVSVRCVVYASPLLWCMLVSVKCVVYASLCEVCGVVLVSEVCGVC